VLTPGPGSPNVLIGGLPAWRGIGAAAAAALSSAKQASDVRVQASFATRSAAMGTPGAPAAIAADEALKVAEAAAMAAMISSMAGMADKHMCVSLAPVPLPPPPHGVGVVIDGSTGVFINDLPACRIGDTILESFGPPNKIVVGLPTVIIGEIGGGGIRGGGPDPAGGAGEDSPISNQVDTLKRASQEGTPFCEVCSS
jgi:uncharacterized Zn-binding protein involved in type VI secretion